MSMLDSVIRETAEKFGLGNRAADLAEEALRLLIDPAQGGLGGWIDRFESAGLGDRVASWIRKGGDKKPLTGREVRSVIGGDRIGHMASALSLARPDVRQALAFLIPRLIDVLTPDGQVATTIPADVQSFLGATEVAAPAPSASGEVASPEEYRGLPWWGWLLAVLWAALLAYWALRQPHRVVATAPPAVQQPPAPAEPEAPPVQQPGSEAVQPQEPAAPPQAATPARLALNNIGGKVEFSGLVPDERTRSDILDLVRSVYGEGNFEGMLDIDPQVAPPQWLTHLRDVLEQVKIPGAELLLEGERISVGGLLSEADQSSLVETLKSAFGPRFSFARRNGAGQVVRTASEKTEVALSALKPGYSGADLVGALNLWVINFPTDSAEIPAESYGLLNRAALAIKGAPGSTVIEIGGHTDNLGDPATNVALSQARAEAVRKALIDAGVNPSGLRTKGYGSKHPVAGNDTPDGRFRNRRIEFTVVE